MVGSRIVEEARLWRRLRGIISIRLTGGHSYNYINSSGKTHTGFGPCARREKLLPSCLGISLMRCSHDCLLRFYRCCSCLCYWQQNSNSLAFQCGLETSGSPEILQALASSLMDQVATCAHLFQCEERRRWTTQLYDVTVSCINCIWYIPLYDILMLLVLFIERTLTR